MLPHVKSGRLRALAMTGAARSPSIPDIPTVAEAGVPGEQGEPLDRLPGTFPEPHFFQGLGIHAGEDGDAELVDFVASRALSRAGIEAGVLPPWGEGR